MHNAAHAPIIIHHGQRHDERHNINLPQWRSRFVISRNRKCGVKMKSVPWGPLGLVMGSGHPDRTLKSIRTRQRACPGVLACYSTALLIGSSAADDRWPANFHAASQWFPKNQEARQHRGIYNVWTIGYRALQNKSSRDVNFMVTGGTGGCPYDNLQCRYKWLGTMTTLEFQYSTMKFIS